MSIQKSEPSCDCGSGTPYDQCCGPLLSNKIQAENPERLMRSRYTAFVRQESAYLMRTWHSRTRPQYLNFEDNPVVWIGLQVHRTEDISPDSTSGIVEFTTNYLENGLLCTLAETSTFLKEDDRWYYLKGDSDLQRTKLERNKPCPCGSGKKFKRCCVAK